MRRALLALLVLAGGAARAAEPAAPDLDVGRDIYVTCAPCHGDRGQGGGGGKYPRIAGFPTAYLKEQLRAFKVRERINIPMYPFTTERELPEADIRDVVAFMASVRLMTVLPPIPEGGMDGLARLEQAKLVLQIPRAEGDLARGRAAYRRDCERCHGKAGEGTEDDPPLAGQHTDYLRRQIADIVAETRFHPRPRKFFGHLTDAEVTDMLAYVSILDDPAPPAIDGE